MNGGEEKEAKEEEIRGKVRRAEQNCAFMFITQQSQERVGPENSHPQEETQTQNERKSKHTDDSIKVFGGGDSIFLKLFGSFVNSKLSTTEW